ncbi:MAG: NAD(+) diphosphatase [Clostridiales bacterium]|nr:NAD(+) diphosphatase [Clostridiales bacterium]
MIQDIDGIFKNEYENVEVTGDDYVIVTTGREVLSCYENNIVTFPQFKEIGHYNQIHYLFKIDNSRYFGVSNASGYPIKYRFNSVEIFREALPRNARFAGITGFGLCSWYDKNHYCGRCGSVMFHDDRERMMKCCECGNMSYPTISPAIIVGVIDGDKILMTKYAGRDYKKYALIAGFNEIGETLEKTVEREVMEEVGIKVKNIRYYKSQPWAFTGTILVGFFADLDGDGTITLDENELAEGVWYKRSDIGDEFADDITLTREMIIAFKNNEI